MRFWQSTAGWPIGRMTELARTAEESGLTGLTIPAHPVYAPHASPAAWLEPWAVAVLLSAGTSRLRFLSSVHLGSLADLFTGAKQVSTAAVLSGGRVAAGVRSGWCADDPGVVDPRVRAGRLAELLPLLGELLTGRPVTHAGEHFAFDTVSLAPVPAEPVPLYAGGHSDEALQRAARTAAGWLGTLPAAPDDLVLLNRLRQHIDRAGRSPGDFEVIVGLPAGAGPDIWARYAAAGVTGFVRAASTEPLEDLRAFARA